MEERLRRLKTALHLEWGELADKLGISRSMLDQTRKGVREFGPQTMRSLIAAEAEAGISSERYHAEISEQTAEYGKKKCLIYDDLDGKADPKDLLAELKRYMMSEFGNLEKAINRLSAEVEALKKGRKS